MEEIVDDKPVEYMDADGQTLVFHYKRGSFRRLETQRTRDLATGKMNGKKGLLKVLVSTRSNRFVLFTLLICIGVTVFLGIFRKQDNDIVGGISCTVSAFSFDEKVYATVELLSTDKKKDDLPVKLTVEFQCINSDNVVADKSLEEFVYEKDRQFVRTVFSDYEMKGIRAIVSIGDESKTVFSKIISR